LFARHGIDSLDDLFEVEVARNLHKASLPSWRERVAVDLEDADGSLRRFFVKRFDSPPRNARARSPRGSKDVRSTAGVERHWLLTVGAAGIPVPRLAAFGEELAGSHEKRSVLVLADVGGESLEQWAAHRKTLAPRALVDALADLARRFHDGGFVHRDLYLSHVFLTHDHADAPTLALIDLQRVMLRPWPRWRWQARDLAQLDYSTPRKILGVRGRLRFLKSYLRGASLKSRESRTLRRRITRMSARIAARDMRRSKAVGVRGSRT
jgi:hypothetical protein